MGGSVVRALAGRAVVRAGSRNAAIRFDFADPSTFEAALAGAEAVFLMRPPRMARARAFAPFLDAAAGAGVRRVVLLSVRGADRVRVLPHHAIERAVRERPFAWTMLRPSDFMQNLEAVHREAIALRGEIALPAGHGRSAFVDVEDVGAVAALALGQDGHEGRSYELTGPRALDFHEVAAILSEALGRAVRYRSVSAPRFVLDERRRGTPLPMALVMTALYTAQRLGAADGVTGEVERLLGRPAGDLVSYVARRRDVWLGPEAP